MACEGGEGNLGATVYFLDSIDELGNGGHLFVILWRLLALWGVFLFHPLPFLLFWIT